MFRYVSRVAVGTFIIFLLRGEVTVSSSRKVVKVKCRVSTHIFIAQVFLVHEAAHASMRMKIAATSSASPVKPLRRAWQHLCGEYI